MTKKRFQAKNDTDLPMVCAWCSKTIDEDEPVFALSAKATPWLDVVANRGSVINMTIESINKTVPVVVAAENSDAAKKGKDLVFMVCSTTCGIRLKAALADDLGKAKTH
jgi:hypothetical protein